MGVPPVPPLPMTLTSTTPRPARAPPVKVTRQQMDERVVLAGASNGQTALVCFNFALQGRVCCLTTSATVQNQQNEDTLCTMN